MTGKFLRFLYENLEDEQWIADVAVNHEEELESVTHYRVYVDSSHLEVKPSATIRHCRFSWGDVPFSELGTDVPIACVMAALMVEAQVIADVMKDDA